MPKWLFPIPQSCGVSTAIRFVQIFLNQVRIDEYMNLPKLLLMTLWGITASMLSHETVVVAIIVPVRHLTPFVRFGVLVVFL